MQHARAGTPPLPHSLEPDTRRFIAHLKGQEGRLSIDGVDTFAEAAILFAGMVIAEDDGDFTVVVIDAETGHSECFVVAGHTCEVKSC